MTAIVCHFLSDQLTKKGKSVAAGWFMLTKIFSYLLVHFLLQTGIIFDECRDGIIDESQVMAWLSYEVITFYLNIVAMSVFLLLSSAKKYHSIRERLGFAADQRKTSDFLNYCKDDIHWFQAWFTMLMLCIMALKMRTRSYETLQTGVGILMTRYFLEVIVLATLYFSTTFEVHTYIKVILGLILVFNFGLIKVFFDLEDQYSVYWAPALLLDIVLHFFIFIQMGLEFATWESTKSSWEKELMFQEIYNDANN